MTFAAASAPLLVVLLTMGVLRWSAAAGAAVVSTALVAALLAFDFAATAPPDVSPAHAATGAFAEALHSAATILWIIFPALSIYELQRRTGAFDRIRNALIGISDNRLLQAVLIAWFGDPRFARFQRLSISVGLFSSESSAKAASPACPKDRQRW